MLHLSQRDKTILKGLVLVVQTEHKLRHEANYYANTIRTLNPYFQLYEMERCAELYDKTILLLKQSRGIFKSIEERMILLSEYDFTAN